MNAALVVYESLFGDSEAVARAIGEGLRLHGNVHVVDVRHAPTTIDDIVDLLVVGGPNHQLSMSRPASRRRAALLYPEAPAAASTGLREWLTTLDASRELSAAAFDTRFSRPALLRKLDRAAASAQRILIRRGLRIIVPAEHFLVESATGPLVDGELDRARAWGDHLGTLSTSHRDGV